MLKKRNTLLAAAVLMSINSVVFASQVMSGEIAKTDTGLQNFNLAEVIVHGDRYIAGEFVRATSNVGILGEQDAMHTPISVTTISEKAVDSFLSSTEGLSKVLSLVPSVQKTYDAAVDCVNIRGFSESGRGFTINGIPGMQAMTRQSTNYIDSIDVIEGPSTGITGSSAYSRDGGTININSKKALKDVDTRKIGLKWHSKSAHEEYVDVGTRFGEDQQWGIRINATNTNGERSIKNWDLEQRSIYVNMDQENEKSKSNFMIGYTYTDSQGRPYGVTVSSKYQGNALPGAPDGDINFNPEWRRDKNTNFVMTLNHEQKLSDSLSAFINLGHFKQDWYYYTGFSKTLINEAGDFTAKADNYSLIEKRDYAQIGLKGDFKTGDLIHNYTVGIDRTWHYYGGPDSTTEEGWFGNIYEGADDNWKVPSFGQADAYYGTHTRVSGWSVMDSITTGNEKLNVLVGLNGKSIKKDNYNSDGSHKKVNGHYYDVSPSFGVNYTFNPSFAVYANHTEEFVEGAIVGNGYTNKGESLDPYKSKQNEIGIKFKTGNFFHKLSYFDIKKANAIDVFNNDGTMTKALDGERRHKGIEYTATGNIAEKWNLIGGLMYLDATQKTGLNKDGTHKASDGKRPNGIPEWTANLGIEYKADDNFSALVRGNYVGSSYVLDEKYGVPSYFTLDAGVKAKTEFNGTPVTVSAMCYNLTDKNYWSASGNVLHLGGPRTFMLSAEFEL